MSAPLLIPLQASPDQTVQAFLGGQNCTIHVYQRRFGLFVDLYVANALLFAGVQAFNLNKLVRDKYLKFTGDLFFFDTQGADDPDYSVLGSRYVLLYDATL